MFQGVFVLHYVLHYMLYIALRKDVYTYIVGARDTYTHDTHSSVFHRGSVAVCCCLLLW